MSEDIFGDIHAVLLQIDKRLAEQGTTLSEALQTLPGAPDEPAPNTDGKEKKSTTVFGKVFGKLFDLVKKKGANPVTDIAEGFAKSVSSFGDHFKNAGSDGASLVERRPALFADKESDETTKDRKTDDDDSIAVRIGKQFAKLFHLPAADGSDETTKERKVDDDDSLASRIGKQFSKLFDFTKKKGSNPVTDIAEEFSKSILSLGDQFKKIGTDGASALGELGGKSHPITGEKCECDEGEKKKKSSKDQDQEDNEDDDSIAERFSKQFKKLSDEALGESKPASKVLGGAVEAGAETTAETGAEVGEIEEAAAAATVGLEGMGAILGPIGLGLTAIVAGSALVVAGFAALVAGLQALTQKVLDSQKELGNFNVGVAAAFAQMKFRDVQRNIQTGNDLAPSITNLTEAFSDFKDALQPLKNILTKLVNNVLAGLLRVMTFFLKIINNLIDILTQIYEFFAGEAAKKKDDKPVGLPIEDFFKARLKGKKRRDQRPPLFAV